MISAVVAMCSSFRVVGELLPTVRRQRLRRNTEDPQSLRITRVPKRSAIVVETGVCSYFASACLPW